METRIDRVERRLGELDKRLDSVKVMAQALERVSEDLNKVKLFCNNIRGPFNNITSLLSMVNIFLTERFPGWDGGLKEATEAAMRDSVRATQILSELDQEVRRKRAPMSDVERIQAADELWGIAGRTGQEARLAAAVAGMYLQARYVPGCRRVLRHLLDDEGSVIEGVSPEAYERLSRRCAELEATSEGSS